MVSMWTQANTPSGVPSSLRSTHRHKKEDRKPITSEHHGGIGEGEGRGGPNGGGNGGGGKGDGRGGDGGGGERGDDFS